MSLSVGAFALVVLPGEGLLATALRDDLHEHHPGVPVVLVVTDEASALQDATPAVSLGNRTSELIEGWSGEDLRAALAPYALERARELAGQGVAVLLVPGLRMLAPLALPPTASLGLVTNPGVSRVSDDGHDPDVTDAVVVGPFSHAIVIAGPEAGPLLAGWKETTHGSRWPSAPTRPLFAVAAEAAVAAGATSVAGDGLILDPRWTWISAGGPWPSIVDLRAFRPSQPWLLDPQARSPRTLLSEHPDLAELVARHCAEMAQSTPGGPTRLTAALTRQWRREGGTPDLQTWLAEPVETAPPSIVPRGLAGIWTSRPDLRAIMPLGLHQDARVLARWWLDHGYREEPFPQVVRQAIEVVAARELEIAPEPTPGITVAGYLGAALGLGTMARLLVEAAQRAHLPVSLVENHRTASRSVSDRPGGLPEGLLHRTTLLAVTGDQTPGFVNDLPQGWREGRRTIGVWAWELDELPPSHRAGFEHVDEVWTISTFTRDAVAAVAACPVEVVPLPVPMPPAHEPGHAKHDLQERLGLPADRDYILFVMDLLSDLDRKNPLGLIEAHARAFPARRGPLLVLKLMNGDREVADAERIRLLARDHDVLLVEDVLTTADMNLLMAGASAYVSLHRSEGFGLTIAEAMAHAVPTIATAYGGNLDFMDGAVSILVPYELVDTPEDSGYAGGHWADPDLDAAAAAMRRLADDPAFARELGQRGRDHIAKVCSWERTMEFLVAQTERTETILAPAPEPPPAPPALRFTSLTRRLVRRVARMPDR